ncbi:MAG: addiction module protein [Deltaproteobacteria bacterium]
MPSETEELLAAALGLPESDLASLAGALPRSLDGEESAEQTSLEEVEAAWADELRWRADDLRSGRVATVPWEQVRQQLEDSISRRGG